MKIFLCLVLLGGCVAPTKARVGAMLVGNAAIVCDWQQTLWMNHGNQWDRDRREINPLLGPMPSQTQIYTASALALLTNTALTFMLKPKWATAWSLGVATGEGLNVLTQPHNPVWRWSKDGACN
jgi:hypothetical protein